MEKTSSQIIKFLLTVIALTIFSMGTFATIKDSIKKATEKHNEVCALAKSKGEEEMKGETIIYYKDESIRTNCEKSENQYIDPITPGIYFALFTSIIIFTLDYVYNKNLSVKTILKIQFLSSGIWLVLLMLNQILLYFIPHLSTDIIAGGAYYHKGSIALDIFSEGFENGLPTIIVAIIIGIIFFLILVAFALISFIGIPASMLLIKRIDKKGKTKQHPLLLTIEFVIFSIIIQSLAWIPGTVIFLLYGILFE